MAGLYDQFEAQCNRLAESMVTRGKNGATALEEGPREAGPPPADGEGEDDKEFGGPPDSNRSSLTHYNPIPSKGDTLFAVSPPRKIVPTNLSSTNTSPFTTSTMTEFVVVADGA